MGSSHTLVERQNLKLPRVNFGLPPSGLGAGHASDPILKFEHGEPVSLTGLKLSVFFKKITKVTLYPLFY